MKVSGLFAGIGGLEVGFAESGHQSNLLCEIWEPARSVLRAHFSDVELASDVARLPCLPGETEVVTAGFPCQDLSQAGMTAGIGGSRSGLVGHIFRLLDQQAVPWVILENVSFMLHLDKGQGMRRLVDEFEARGYRWAYRVVNSLSFVPQRRERVLFVATLSETDPAAVLHVDDVTQPGVKTSLDSHAHGFYWTEGLRGVGWAQDAVPTLKNGSTIGIASPPAILLPTGEVITPDVRDAERLQGFSENWTLPCVDIIKASYRWALVGNAVTVPVAKWLGSRLLAPGEYDRSRDREMPHDGRWPRAARFDGKITHRVEIGSFPVWSDRAPLATFLNYAGKPLSPRATRGFLSRAARSTLNFAPGFIDRLSRHLADVETSASSKSTNSEFGLVQAE